MKPSGMAIRATVVIAVQSTSGSQPYSARTPTTSATANPNEIGWLITTRYQPGAQSFAAQRHLLPPPTSRRYFTSVSISSGESWSL